MLTLAVTIFGIYYKELITVIIIERRLKTKGGHLDSLSSFTF